MIVEFRTARISDAREIIGQLRDRDLDGLRMLGDPVTIVIEAMQDSVTAFTGTADGVPAVMWGLRSASLLDDRVYLWMLGTKIVDEHPVHFLRHSRKAMRLMRERYSLIYGECARDFVKSVRWITWLGGKVWAPNPEGGGRLIFAIEGTGDGS